MKHTAKKISWGLLAIAIVIFLGVLIWQKRGPEGVQTISNLGNAHIENIDSRHAPYNSKPPTSGPHVNSIASWGIHDEQVPDELQVHNLEDGGVIISYDAQKTSSAELEELKQIVLQSNRSHVLLAPYSGMESKITLTAWTKFLPLGYVDADKINKFINAYEGRDHHVAY